VTSYEIILSSGTKTFVISPSGSAHLVEGGLEGFSSAAFDVSIQPYASSAGGYAQKRRFAERDLSLTFELERADADSTCRTLLSMLDPTRDCEITVTLDSVTRVITAIPCDEPKIVHRTFADTVEISLSFLAPTVFFRDVNETVVRFRDGVPMLAFPLNLMSGAGTVSGLYRAFDSVSVWNPGDGECGFVAHLTAVGGTVVNPVIRLGEEYIKCLLTLADGDEVVIDTRPRRKNIVKNGVRCFSFDPQSTFFPLPAGESTLAIGADSGEEYLSGYASFLPIYYGV